MTWEKRFAALYQTFPEKKIGKIRIKDHLGNIFLKKVKDERMVEPQYPTTNSESITMNFKARLHNEQKTPKPISHNLVD